jgi:AcrR family transcriptional regulator
MPAPARTSLDHIVRAARLVLERDGLDGLTMQAVAAEVGVRAPSLYKHVDGRAGLVRLAISHAIDEIADLQQSVPVGPPTLWARALADAFRAFGHANPVAFGMVFAPAPDEWRPDPSRLANAAAPLLAAAAGLVGPDDALPAARALTASCFGFVSMELAGAFRLGGDVDAAWDYTVDMLIGALDRHASGSPPRPPVAPR